MTRWPGGVWLVSDRRRLAPAARSDALRLASLERQCEEAMDAGVDAIQIRERDLDAAPLMDTVRRLARRAREAGTRIAVNDRADVASLARVGLHLRSDGPPVGRLRAFLWPHAPIGRSIHSRAEAVSHAASDYLLFGTVFESASKEPDATPVGLVALRDVAQASLVPVVAIGGIDPSNAGACVRAGAAGVAGIGMFLPEAVARAGGMAALVRALHRALDERQNGRRG